jgi:phage shock protein C
MMVEQFGSSLFFGLVQRKKLPPVRTGEFIRKELSMSPRGSLRRSRRNRMIAGVCGGFGEFFGIGAFWFRLAFLISLIPGGVPGFLLYLLFWLIIPSE